MSATFVSFLFLFVLQLLFFLHHSSSFNQKQIILLVGQSNMGGKGGINQDGTWDEYVPPECSPRPDILRLSHELVWEEATEPLHRDVDNRHGNTLGIGPGMPFATAVLTKDPSFGVIGLVPAAQAGSNITQWHRNSVLYERFMTRAKAAVVEAEGTNVLRGMLWYQGESDTKTLDEAIMYKTRVEQFFTDVRSDLQLPFLPIIQVALASGFNTTYLDIVRKAQLELEMPYVICVDAMGLELQPHDPIHLTTTTQLKLGEMLAQAFLEIIQ